MAGLAAHTDWKLLCCLKVLWHEPLQQAAGAMSVCYAGGQPVQRQLLAAAPSDCIEGAGCSGGDLLHASVAPPCPYDALLTAARDMTMIRVVLVVL